MKKRGGKFYNIPSAVDNYTSRGNLKLLIGDTLKIDTLRKWLPINNEKL